MAILFLLILSQAELCSGRFQGSAKGYFGIRRARLLEVQFCLEGIAFA
jgi:hypothetical protein